MYEYIIKAVAEGIARLFVILFVGGIAIGALLMWLVPKLWS